MNSFMGLDPDVIAVYHSMITQRFSALGFHRKLIFLHNYFIKEAFLICCPVVMEQRGGVGRRRGRGRS